MAEEILRRHLDLAFDPGPDFPHPSLLSRTMAAVAQDAVRPVRRRKLDRPAWLLPLVAALLVIAIAMAVIASNLLHHRPTVPVHPAAPPVTRSYVAQMMSATSGWSRPNGTLLRTADAGAHWKAVTAPSALLLDPNQPGSQGEGYYFLGPNMAWISRDLLLPGRPLEFVVFRTIDGGATWVQSAPVTVGGVQDVCCGSQFIWPYFLDSTHGWLLMDLDAGHQFLFLTEDGGVSWTHAATNLYTTLPSTGCEWQVPTFVTPTVGYMGITVPVCPEASKHASLLATADGGRSWHMQPLGVGPEVTCSFGCLDPGPTFVDDHNGFIDTGAYGGSGRLLATTDAGQTWSVRPKPPAYSGWLDAKTGWGWRQSRATGVSGATPSPNPVLLYVTHDGGFSWAQVANDLSGQIRSLYFVDQRDSFAVIEIAPGSQELARTVDGGTHWLVVGPITAT